MSKHTPTPWTLDRTLAHAGKVKRVVDCSVAIPEATDGEANAAFIVRAVNAHDALVKALEELTEEAFRNMRGGKGHLIDNAWAALKLAKGGG